MSNHLQPKTIMCFHAVFDLTGKIVFITCALPDGRIWVSIVPTASTLSSDAAAWVSPFHRKANRAPGGSCNVDQLLTHVVSHIPSPCHRAKSTPEQWRTVELSNSLQISPSAFSRPEHTSASSFQQELVQLMLLSASHVSTMQRLSRGLSHLMPPP